MMYAGSGKIWLSGGPCDGQILALGNDTHTVVVPSQVGDHHEAARYDRFYRSPLFVHHADGPMRNRYFIRSFSDAEAWRHLNERIADGTLPALPDELEWDLMIRPCSLPNQVMTWDVVAVERLASMPVSNTDGDVSPMEAE